MYLLQSYTVPIDDTTTSVQGLASNVLTPSTPEAASAQQIKQQEHTTSHKLHINKTIQQRIAPKVSMSPKGATASGPSP